MTASPTALKRSMGVGILAYGSLISEPGREIGPLIARRIPTATPFPVEYGRLSRSRGGAPTVVPHLAGCSVKAEVLVLFESVSFEEAKNLLWRREVRKEGSGHAYKESSSPDAVLVRDSPGFCGLNHGLYTDFNASGKLDTPEPRGLAKAAANSVGRAPNGKDGISYLIDLLDAGVVTALTARYEKELLILTNSPTLAEALIALRNRTRQR